MPCVLLSSRLQLAEVVKTMLSDPIHCSDSLISSLMSAIHVIRFRIDSYCGDLWVQSDGLDQAGITLFPMKQAFL